MAWLDLTLAGRSVGRLGGIVGGPPAPPRPLAMLPALTTPGAGYHAVYSLSRLMPAYAGPLAYVVPGEGASGASDVGAGTSDIAAGDLPAAVSPLWGLYDQSGNHYDIQQPTLAQRPRLRAEVTIGSRLAAAFDGIPNDNTVSSLSGPQALVSNNRTEFFLVDPTASIMSGVWSEHADSSGAIIRDAYVKSAPGTFEAAQVDTACHIHAGPQVVAIVEDATGTTFYVDGVGYALPPAGLQGNLARVTLGASVFGTQYNANLRLGAYVAVAGALGAGDVAAVAAALLDRFGVAGDYAVNIVHIGDSIVQGLGATDTIGLREQVDPLLHRRARWWNLGVAGKTLAQCYADISKHEAALIAAGKQNLAIIDGGINDIGTGSGGSALYANTTTPYVAALTALGYKVAVVTLLPQASGNYPADAQTIDGERQSYNAAVRANAAGADLVIDRAAESHMGIYPTSCQDTTLYSPTIGGTAIHPTTLGYSYLAPVYAAAINGVT